MLILKSKRRDLGNKLQPCVLWEVFVFQTERLVYIWGKKVFKGLILLENVALLLSSSDF